MDNITVRFLAEVLQLNTEIQGMIAENKQREGLEQSMAYTEEDFAIKAQQFDNIIRKWW